VNRQSWIALIALSLGWGTRGVATRLAFDHGVETLTLVSVRLAIAAVLVVAIQGLITKRFSTDRQVMTVGAVLAVTNVVGPFWFFTAAFHHASAGFVGLMAALTPLGTALFAHFMLPDEPLSRAKTTGLVLGIVGVAILVASGDSGLTVGGNPALAVAWAMPGVALFSFSTVFGKRHEASMRGLSVVTIQIGLGAVIAVFPMLIFEGVPNLGIGAWTLLGYLAVFSTIVPLVLFYWVLVRSSAGQVALAGYLVPLVSVIAGIVLLDETVGPGILLGGMAILGGVVLADRSAGKHELVVS
jgi:drug/metabolite transporter (DMT)-like permease